MATTAAIFDELTQQAIFVGIGGHPTEMVTMLDGFVEDGKREELFAVADYLVLGTADDYWASAGESVPGIGVAYRNQGERLTMKREGLGNEPIFYDGAKYAHPDYAYSITPDGRVITHHKF
jgi:hypothetical protein